MNRIPRLSQTEARLRQVAQYRVGGRWQAPPQEEHQPAVERRARAEHFLGEPVPEVEEMQAAERQAQQRAVLEE